MEEPLLPRRQEDLENPPLPDDENPQDLPPEDRRQEDRRQENRLPGDRRQENLLPGDRGREDRRQENQRQLQRQEDRPPQQEPGNQRQLQAQEEFTTRKFLAAVLSLLLLLMPLISGAMFGPVGMDIQSVSVIESLVVFGLAAFNCTTCFLSGDLVTCAVNKFGTLVEILYTVHTSGSFLWPPVIVTAWYVSFGLLDLFFPTWELVGYIGIATTLLSTASPLGFAAYYGRLPTVNVAMSLVAFCCRALWAYHGHVTKNKNMKWLNGIASGLALVLLSIGCISRLLTV
ncbi:uncharacterized protein LOC112348632 [Selaginella moellendorffii]|uniref:uncharacterized protein LOC112348632 n=1 Tax=Selaginella moellendorffii TaxID=88036 RepID=UPI000D1C69DE|nr:uncharacterized protein LOC112348632 [Selaginella moellendorffii]|eukprot:XP_024537289.1 uncharacterized protein LOC112348632 [Selaginella moellendorffii]